MGAQVTMGFKEKPTKFKDVYAQMEHELKKLVRLSRRNNTPIYVFWSTKKGAYKTLFCGDVYSNERLNKRTKSIGVIKANPMARQIHSRLVQPV